MNALRILGALWALPCSLFGWALVSILRARVHSRLGTTFLFVPAPGSWLDRSMREGSWAGFSIGDVVLIREDWITHPEVLEHELRHTAQVHVLGILVIPAWLIGLVASFVIANWRVLYWNHPFEMDARAAANRAAESRRDDS